ncbi:DUF3999 family protein [Ramlibacter humi]|uniref:DUF3999 family protein n=1 Tax=Ramlibacter humi TaxID=2530451 RepID=A0A4Z0BYL8_9BURK|nr:DUF3999 family protein [Ramlibacter humi]TFZ03782.1 DUF3999 family protein [Ramlibacter humi]
MTRPLLILLLAPAAALAAALSAGDFAWRADIEAPSGGGLARVPLPAEALMQARSAGLADLRVFDTRGEPLPFAMRRPGAAAAAPVAGPELPAHVLTRTRGPSGAGGRSIQVRVKGAQGESAWVQFGGGGTTAGEPLQSVLFDVRQEKRAVTALRLQAELPANTPVRLSAFTSTDLADWQPLPLRGSLFRFEGAPELDNRTLALASPQMLQGRYLRLDWETAGVRVDSAIVLAAGEVPRERVAAALPAPTPVNGGLEWQLPTTVPIAALSLASTKPGTLVPVQVLGRRDPALPWTPIARATVFRLGPAGAENTNPPLTLAGATPRWLRVEALRGLPLGELSAGVEFEPVEVVYLASGPSRLAIGRADAPPADVPLATFAAALPGGGPDALPLARLGRIEQRAGEAAAPSWLPRGVTPATAALWSVLLLGVLVLAVVAARLMRQLKAAAPPSGEG